MWAEEMAPWVKSLPHKHKDLSSDPQTLCQKPSLVVGSCQPCADEMGGRDGGPLERTGR